MHSLLPLIFAAGTVLSSNLIIATRAFCGENDHKICYGVDGGDSQQLDVEDVKYVAAYLRYLGDNNHGSAKFWNMPKAIDCAEWTLPVSNGGSVLALAKHINPRINSSILYEDIAAAIDGGLEASDENSKKSLLGCGVNGGQMGVAANLNNPSYNTQEYKDSKAQPQGIIVKLVKAPKTD